MDDDDGWGAWSLSCKKKTKKKKVQLYQEPPDMYLPSPAKPDQQLLLSDLPTEIFDQIVLQAFNNKSRTLKWAISLRRVSRAFNKLVSYLLFEKAELRNFNPRQWARYPFPNDNFAKLVCDGFFRQATSGQNFGQLCLWEMVQVAIALLTSATPTRDCYTTACRGGSPDLIQQKPYIMYRCVYESMLCLFEPHWVCQLFDDKPLLSATTEQRVRRLSRNSGELWALTAAAYAGDDSFVRRRLQALRSDLSAVSADRSQLRSNVSANFEDEEQNRNDNVAYGSSGEEWPGLENISSLWRILAISGDHEEDNLNPLSATLFIAMKRGNTVLVSSLLDEYPELLTEPFISHKFGAEGFLEAALAAETDFSLFMLLAGGIKVPVKSRDRNMLFKCVQKSIDGASHHVGPQRFYTLKRVIGQWGAWQVADFKNHLLHRAALRNDIELAEFVFDELGDKAKSSRYESPDWSALTAEKTDYLYAAAKTGRIDFLKFVLERASSFHTGKTRCFYSCDFCTMRRACITDMISGILPMDHAIFELILSNSQDMDFSTAFRNAAETFDSTLLGIFTRNIDLNAYMPYSSSQATLDDFLVGQNGLRGAIKKLRVDNVKLLMREHGIEMPYQCTLPRISKEDGEQMEKYRELKAFLKEYEIKADVEVQYVVTFKKKKPPVDTADDQGNRTMNRTWDFRETSVGSIEGPASIGKETDQQKDTMDDWDDWVAWGSGKAKKRK